jgi:hypothetical protein
MREKPVSHSDARTVTLEKRMLTSDARSRTTTATPSARMMTAVRIGASASPFESFADENRMSCTVPSV